MFSRLLLAIVFFSFTLSALAIDIDGSYSESFESNSTPTGFSLPLGSNAAWTSNALRFKDGAKSLRSGVIGHNQESSIVLTANFLIPVILSFDTFVSSESCCDHLEVYVDGTQVLNLSNNQDWQTQVLQIPSGSHTITWTYDKDGSAAHGDDAAYIDNITVNELANFGQYPYGLVVIDYSSTFHELGVYDSYQHVVSPSNMPCILGRTIVNSAGVVTAKCSSSSSFVEFNAALDTSTSYPTSSSRGHFDNSQTQMFYVGSGLNALYSYVTATQTETLLYQVPSGKQITDIFYADSSVWLLLNDNSIQRINAITGSDIGNLALSSQLSNGNVDQLAVLPDGTLVISGRDQSNRYYVAASNSAGVLLNTTYTQRDNANFNDVRDIDVLPNGHLVFASDDLFLTRLEAGKLVVLDTLSTKEFSYVSTRNFAVDTDNDGLPDDWEAYFNTDSSNPADAVLDGDSDGLSNLEEYQNFTDPANADSDNDGLADGDEVNIHGSSPVLADGDGDSLSDFQEVTVHLTNPATIDSDGDGLDDNDELNVHSTNPLLADTDADGMPDTWEVEQGTNPVVADAQGDSDSDGLTNLGEFQAGTLNLVKDSDADLLNDGDEITAGTDPLNPDSDNDGMRDGYEALYASLNPLLNTDAAGDFDGDGYTNLEESWMLTIPDSTRSSARTLPAVVDAAIGERSKTSAVYGHNAIVAVDNPPTLAWVVEGFNDIEVGPISHDGSLYFESEYYDSTTSNRTRFFERRSLFSGDVIQSTEYTGSRTVYGANGFVGRFSNSFEYDAIDSFPASTNAINSLYNSHAAIDHLGRAFYLSNSRTLVALDANQNRLFEYTQPNSFGFVLDARNNTILTYQADAIKLLDATTGAVKHTIPFVAEETGPVQFPRYSERVDAVVTQANNIILSGNSGSWGINAESGHLFWSLDTQYYNLRYSSGGIFSLSGDRLLKIDERTGDVEWRHQFNFNIDSSVLSTNYLIIENNATIEFFNLDTRAIEYTLDLSTIPTSGSNNFFTPHISLVDSMLIVEDSFAIAAYDLSGDRTANGLPDGWERIHGDRVLGPNVDLDSDGLINRKEFENGTNPLVSDTDGDGLSDSQEVDVIGSSPLLSDSDRDGLSDGDEVNTHGTNPLQVDSDGDGLDDFLELNATSTDPNNADSDGDSMSDFYEVNFLLNPNNASDASVDLDGDGLVNSAEFAANTSPLLADTDGDGLADGAEVLTHGSNPNSSDSDEDGMPDFYEVRFQLNPSVNDARLDADNDRWSNGDEFFWQTIPNDGTSFPTQLFGYSISESEVLYRIDLNTGTLQEIGDLDVGNIALDALTFIADGRLIAINGSSLIYQIDLSTGKATKLPTLSSNVLAFVRGATYGPNNDIYVVTDNNTLGRLDLINNAYLDIGNTNFSIDALTFVNGVLYGASERFDSLYTIDIATGAATLVGRLTNGNLDRAFGLSSHQGQLWAISAGGSILKVNHASGSSTPVASVSSSFRFASLAIVPADTDNDGMPDLFERFYGLDPNSALDATLDLDDDGLNNLQEYSFNSKPNNADSDGDGLTDYLETQVLGSNPGAVDTDDDGMPDGWEYNNQLNVNVDDASLDADNDGWTNAIEYRFGTNPQLASSFPTEEIAYSIDESTDSLYSINLTTGAATLVGSTTVRDDFEGATFDSAGRLLVVGDIGRRLYEVNVVTGKASLIGNFSGPASEYGFSVGPNGVLYLVDGRNLFTIDGSNGDANTIGSLTGSFSVDAMAFDGATMYGLDASSDSLVSINTTTGAATVIGPLTNVNLSAQSGLSVDSSGAIWGIEENSGSLFTVDKSTGLAMVVHTGALGRYSFESLAIFVSPDSDGDGMPDSFELAAGLDPDNAGDRDVDGDNDGLSNFEEFTLGTSLSVADTDTDGLSDGDEVNMHNTSPIYVDTDGDGIWDEVEISSGLSPLDRLDALLDSDGDGVSNIDEALLGLAINNADTDGDGMPDGWEVSNGLDAGDASDAASDLDADGSSNLNEYQNGTLPNDSSSVGGGSGGAVISQARSDIDGDNAADFVMLDTSTNTFNYTLLDNNVLARASGTIGSYGNWQPLAKGDFVLGDSVDFLLLRGNNLHLSIITNGGTTRTDERVMRIDSFREKLVGVGDYDGDGQTDWLIQHLHSNEHRWYKYDSSVGVLLDGVTPREGWRYGMSGDFDGDGTDDMYFFNPYTNEGIVHLMDAGTIRESRSIDVSGLAGTVPVESGDIDGDGDDELVVRDVLNEATLWVELLDASGQAQSSSLIVKGSARLVELADYDQDGYVDILWQTDSGAIEISTQVNGTVQSTSTLDTVSANEYAMGQVYGRALPPQKLSKAVRNDFDRDGFSDLLFVNNVNDRVRVSTSVNYLFVEDYFLPNLVGDWEQESGDFNGDGYEDILWRDKASGEWHIELLSAGGGSVRSRISGDVNFLESLDMEIRGVDDMDGDGKADIVAHNPITEELYIALMSGAEVIRRVDIGQLPNKEVSVGDFLDDRGESEIFLKDTVTGSLDIFRVNANSGRLVRGVNVGQLNDVSWSVNVVGDFDGDGDDDIIWEHDVRRILWRDLLEDGSAINGRRVLKLRGDWVLQEVGDYNGDGTEDLVFYNTLTTRMETAFMKDGILQRSRRILGAKDWRPY